ncbi:MAG: hypothetical protein ACPLKS_06095 [Caldisericum exile]|uniref:hypothetical protein n=1 Tax=Caldisericum exile TaxID=693075 RepID=UPI003C75A0A2
MKLYESFEWAKIPDDMPRKNLAFIVAKTTKPTIHPEDPEYSVRLFDDVDELREAARSLARREVGLNHSQVIPEAFTIDAQWNDKEKQIEALLYLPDEYIRKIKEGKIKHVSVEYRWRDEERTSEGVRFKGLVFDRVDLLEGINPGDKNTYIKLLEGKKGLMDGEIEMVEESTGLHESAMEFVSVYETVQKLIEGTKKLGEPFAGFADWEDCIRHAKAKGVTNPEAYCGYIKHKVEDPKKKEQKVDVPETGDYIHVRVEDPDKYDPESFRTMDVTEGVKARIGCPKGQFEDGKCKVGMQVQVYLFDKDKFTEEQAKKWVEEHKKESLKEDGVEVPKDKVLATSGKPQEPIHVPEEKGQVPEVPSNPLSTGPMQAPKTPEQVEEEKKVMLGKAVSPEPDLSKLVPPPKVESAEQKTTEQQNTMPQVKPEDRIRELEEAVKKLQNVVKETEQSISRKIEEAVKKAKEEERRRIEEQLKRKYISGVYAKNRIEGV